MIDKFSWGLQGPNIVNAHACDHMCQLLFNDEPVIRLPIGQLDWGDLAVAAGFFPSKNQARKNGWLGQVPYGFGLRKFGKGKGVWYYNPSPETETEYAQPQES